MHPNRLHHPARTIFSLTLAISAVAAPFALAEAPAKPPLAWRLDVAPDAGFGWTASENLVVRDDAAGGALAVFAQARQENGTTQNRPLVVAIDATGKLLARSSPITVEADYMEHAAALDRGGYVLATASTKGAFVFRLARDGKVLATQPVRFASAPNAITGVAANARGTVAVFGGYGPGPAAPAIASLDAAGRGLWHYAGPNPMPPGGVPALRFRRGGGIEAFVMDREKSFWDRRSSAGVLIARVPLKMPGWECVAFLGEGRVVQLLFNWPERPVIAEPLNRWVLVVNALPDRMLAGPKTLDASRDANASCSLAANEAGWIAASLDRTKIAVFDAGLALRAEIDLKAAAETVEETIELDRMAIDAKGAVTAIVSTGPKGEGRRIVGFAKIAP